MSFILDALKKSEDRRQKEELATTRKRVLVMGGTGPRRWPLWLVVALLPTALLVGWWLGQTPLSEPPRDTLQATGIEPAGPSPRQPQTVQIDPVPQTAPPAAPSGQVLPAGHKPLSEPDLTTGNATPEATAPAPPPAPVPVQKTQPKTSSRTVPQSRPVAAATVRPEATSPPTYIELPREVRDRMPVLKISLHFFSTDPVRRLVRINGRLLHEGETVSDGLTIHEITESTTIFDYQGLLFEVPSSGG